MVGILLVLSMVFMYDMVSVFINHQLLGDRVDRLALEAAAKFNEGDQASRMNHLLVQSRDLIFRSRQTCEITAEAQPFNHLQPLAFKLLEQSRAGSRLLERERERLVAVRLAEVKKRLESDCLSASGLGQIGGETLDIVDVGTINGFSSGVSSAAVKGELKADDLRQRYIDKKTGLYLGEINAKLPNEDGDLSFKLCGLPATAKQGALQKVVDYKSYAVLLKDGAEVPFKCEQMPSVVRVTVHGNYGGLLIRHSYALSGSAMATSAGPAFR
jgi:hypothetical protein